ncbi:MAG TPA: MBL fold metallo-hydrolase [Ktedonosporobacter sp.]|jgi:cyclase|nr:MBL fold metallo-hydrolase [Ktedonosporobacter sp.]
MPEFTLQEVVPGVLAAFGGICNRGIIANGGNALVIDSGISVAEATPLRDAAQERCRQGALSLFNTHPHGDHVFGNQVFGDGLIIAHQGVRENMLTTGVASVAAFKQNPQMAEQLGDITITPPTVIFQDTLTVFVGAIEVQLIYFGLAHSPSDSFAWLPQSRTLFTGDLLFNELVPAMPPGGSIANWIVALERLEQLQPQHVIPGHGPILPPDALGVLRSWMLELRARVTDAVAQGLDQEACIAKLAPEMQALAPRTREERMPRAIQAAYDEVSRTSAQTVS